MSQSAEEIFDVPANKINTLVEFQDKCRANGHKSYSSVIIKLIENYNKNN